MGESPLLVQAEREYIVVSEFLKQQSHFFHHCVLAILNNVSDKTVFPISVAIITLL